MLWVLMICCRERAGTTEAGPAQVVKVADMDDENTGIAAKRSAGLRPFTKGDHRARDAALRSVEVRRAKRAIERAESLDVAQQIRTLIDTHDRATLGPAAFAVAVHVVGKVLTGAIPVRNGAEAADLLRALVDIGRLESGDATRTVAVAHLSGPALAARLRELQRDAGVIPAESSAPSLPADELPSASDAADLQ